MNGRNAFDFDVLDLGSSGLNCGIGRTHHWSGDFFVPLYFLSVGMHGAVVAVVVSMILMIVDGYSCGCTRLGPLSGRIIERFGHLKCGIL
jgi:hypothetical protein